MRIPYNTGITGWRDAKRLSIRVPVILGDALMIMLAYSLAFLIRFESNSFIYIFPVTKGYPSPEIYVRTYPVVVIMWVMAISWQGCYRRIQIPALDDIIRLFRGSIVGTFLAMSAMFLYRESSYSRLVFILGGGITWMFLSVYRGFIKVSYVYWVQRNKRPRRVLVLGKGYLSKSLKKILDGHGDRAVLTAPGEDVKSIERTILRSRINEVLLAHPDIPHKDVVHLSGFCEENHVIFRLIPDILEIRMGEIIVDESLGVPTIQIKPVSLQGTAFLTKRVMDVVFSSLLIGIFFFPLMFIAFLIKITSKGTVLYHHARVGFRQREFQFMKFRTMVFNADDLLGKLKEKSDRKGPVFKMKNDPRITWIGKYLRRYSMDEIPQLLNVLRGEMSLVGPRPQVLWEAKMYDEWAKKRLNVLPGITGLWQVSGRAELTYEEMIDLDIYYIEHWSPGLDIKILLRTIPAVLFAKGAY